MHKNIVLILVSLAFTPIVLLNCNTINSQSKFLVTTKVEIKDGKIDDVLRLFKKTNPDLVKNESDWVKAIFSKNDDTNTVMVQAYWKDKQSYLNFSQSENFINTMKEFSPYFKGKPQVEINHILFEM